MLFSIFWGSRVFQNEQFLIKNWSKFALGGHVGHLEANLSQHNGILSHLGGHLVQHEPTWSQHEPTWSQHGTNMEPTWSQHGANLRPTWGGGMSSHGGFFRGSHLGANMAQLEPTWSQFGPTWPQLEPTSSQLGSKLDPFCLKKSKLEAMLKLSYITLGKQKNYIPRYPKLSNMTMHHPRPGGMRGTVESAAPLGARARNVVLKA